VSAVVKTHACGSLSNQKTTTDSEWPRLPYVGRLELDDKHDAEMRNCPECGSTIAVEVPR